MPRPFIHDDFLLTNPTAARLYHEFAAPQPILDYHNHLPAGQIADDHQFADITEAWLAGDHYKWRAMRACGVHEQFCTGKAEPYDKFLAWARVVPQLLRSPLYHWTHLELKRYFGIDELLSERTAPAIWEQANAQLTTPDLSVRGILSRFRVEALCTTDDPADDLAAHARIASSELGTRVYPAFRPDRALQIHDPAEFNAWVDRLGIAAGVGIDSFAGFLDALDRRHAAFHAAGCRLSDHGLARCPDGYADESDAAEIFSRVRSGYARRKASADASRFAGYMMLFFGRLDARRGWAKQMHLGALRDANTRAVETLGPDTGYDAMGDLPQVEALARYMDRLEQEGSLPKMILYNNNPRDTAAFAALAGSFQNGVTPGKIQYGAAWWFLDAKDGITQQLNALSNVGVLSRFIGMLTDSRSFLSFPRHDYFRRVLCDLLGREVETGELPNDDGLLSPLIENICIGNVRRFLALPDNVMKAAS